MSLSGNRCGQESVTSLQNYYNMRRRVKVKANGWIIEVRPSMDCTGRTVWVEDLTETEYYPEELEFFPIKPDVINPFPPMEMFDILTPMEMSYDPQSMTARFVQDMNIRVTKEVVEQALKIATNKQLRDELQRRANGRKALKGEELRCRNCKHCIQGYTTRRAASRGYKTAVCELQPKDKEWRGCFYSTLHSRKACDKFEKK